jgi:hypothetical protein
MQTSGSSTAGGSSALPVPSSEQPAKISKEMQEFGDKFTQSIIAQFQRCLVPIEEKLAKFEKHEERILEFERQFSKMHEKNSDDFEIRQTFKFENGSEAKNENFSRRESFGSSSLMRSPSSTEGSSLAGAISATRLKQPEIKYSDDISIEKILVFLDDCLQYVTSWEALPSNKGRTFPDAEHFPLLIMPKEVAEYICQVVGLIYSFQSKPKYSDHRIQMMATEGKLWKNQDGDSIRELLITARNEFSSTSMKLERLHSIKWKSDSPYSLNAFSKFSHDIAQEIRFTETGKGDFKYEEVDLKDHIISSFPDPKYQRELYAIFGNRGIMKTSSFETGHILEKIEIRIKTFMRENISAEMNASAMHRRKNQSKVNFVDQFFADENAVQEDETSMEGVIQDQINAVMLNPGNCRNIGVGSDKKLICRFLGGEKKSCTFKHPPSDLAMKGTGVSKDTISKQPSSFSKQGGKIHAVLSEDCAHEEDTVDNSQDEA